MLDMDSLTFLLVSSKVGTTLGFCGNLVCKGKHSVMDYSPWRGEVNKVLVLTFLVTKDTHCYLG